MNKLLVSSLLLGASIATPAFAADYVIDNQGAHASINFETSHMGFSVLTGRFNKFQGEFSYDEQNIETSKITVSIDTRTIDSNHAKRDKHLRSDDFIDANKYPEAKFVSSNIKDLGNGKLEITGNFTLKNVTKSIVINAVKVGEGKDPWGGYRVGFSGTTQIAMKDYGFKMDFGTVDLNLHIEGIRQ